MARETRAGQHWKEQKLGVQGRPRAWLSSLPMGGQQDGLPKRPSHVGMDAEPYKGPVRIAGRGPWDSAVPRCLRCPSPSEELSGQGLPGAAS